MTSETFHVYDTTLRDGAQREGISYSVTDKLAVARLLDELGVGFIEGGWPGAMPKDTEFFRRARTELELRHAQLVAFGATRKAGVAVEDDSQVRALLDSGAQTLCLVAKSDVRHVTKALRTSYQENLEMIADTVRYGVAQGRRVFLDCEHFFDGYRADPEYATDVVRTGFEAGADVVVLCDTNGGMLPSGISTTITELAGRLDRLGHPNPRLGIHAQNDTGCAVANTVAAVEAGAMHVQGTANGYGERPGNADIFTVIGNLALKLGMPVLPDGCLEQMVRVSHAIAEIANLAPDTHQAYVGSSAFAHKAGLHASAIKVDPELYNHVDPATVGNDMRILVTEMAGRASVELKSRELGVDLAGHPEALARVAAKVKDLEAAGWSFEAADASFELLVRGELNGGLTRPFALESYRVIVEHREDGAVVSEATVKVRVRGERVIATAEGNGPVNALDSALRQALVRHYPRLADVELVDYKVRILEGSHGTGAITRVLVESAETSCEAIGPLDTATEASSLRELRPGSGGLTDTHREWVTVGVHDNVVEASWHALVDGLTYAVVHQGAPA